jgi:serine/threonine protein kinase
VTPARIGEYLVIGRLGEGGQGVVYLCRTREGRPVAIKLLHPRPRIYRFGVI